MIMKLMDILILTPPALVGTVVQEALIQDIGTMVTMKTHFRQIQVRFIYITITLFTYLFCWLGSSNSWRTMLNESSKYQYSQPRARSWKDESPRQEFYSNSTRKHQYGYGYTTTAKWCKPFVVLAWLLSHSGWSNAYDNQVRLKGRWFIIICSNSLTNFLLLN